MTNEQVHATEPIVGPSIEKQIRWEQARQAAVRDAKVFSGSNPGKLPSQFQPNDVCQFVLWDWQDEEITARILKVHFTESKVLYDAQLYLPTYDHGAEYGSHTRIYNVDSAFFHPSNERPHLVQPAE